MKCAKCGHNLPNDSKFCQYCGSSISEDITSQVEQNATQPTTTSVPPVEISLSAVDETPNTYGNYRVSSSDVAFVPEDRRKELLTQQTLQQITSPRQPIPSEVVRKEEPSIPIAEPSKKQGNKALLIVLAIITLISVPFNIVQQIKAQERTETISALLEEKGELEKEVSSQAASIKTLRNKVSSLEDDADGFRKIVSAGKKGNLGYANRYFEASDDIVVVRKNSTHKITLTTGYSATYEISYDQLYPSASISFDEDNWWGSTTTLTVLPNKTGVTVATFSNSINSETFSIIIIVTD